MAESPLKSQTGCWMLHHGERNVQVNVFIDTRLHITYRHVNHGKEKQILNNNNSHA